MMLYECLPLAPPRRLSRLEPCRRHNTHHRPGSQACRHDPLSVQHRAHSTSSLRPDVWRQFRSLATAGFPKPWPLPVCLNCGPCARLSRTLDSIIGEAQAQGCCPTGCALQRADCLQPRGPQSPTLGARLHAHVLTGKEAIGEVSDRGGCLLACFGGGMRLGGSVFGAEHTVNHRGFIRSRPPDQLSQYAA